MNLSLMKPNHSLSTSGEPLTIICYTCSMPSSREWAQRCHSRPSDSGSPYFPFLLTLNPPQGAIIKEDASTFLCAFCHAALEYQWNIYELESAKSGTPIPPTARKYSTCKFCCAVCGVVTYRKRVRALPFQEFPFLAKSRQPGSLTLGNNPLAVVCLDCSETLWAQSAEYDRWGLPVDKRHFNWMARPPPPEDSVEATVARLPSGETQLPRCPPTEPSDFISHSAAIKVRKNLETSFGEHHVKSVSSAHGAPHSPPQRKLSPAGSPSSHPPVVAVAPMSFRKDSFGYPKMDHSPQVTRLPHPMLAHQGHAQSHPHSSGVIFAPPQAAPTSSFGTQFSWVPPGHGSTQDQRRSSNNSDSGSSSPRHHHYNIPVTTAESSTSPHPMDAHSSQAFGGPGNQHWPWLAPFPLSSDLIRYQSLMNSAQQNLADIYSGAAHGHPLPLLQQPTSSSGYIYPFPYHSPPPSHHPSAARSSLSPAPEHFRRNSEPSLLPNRSSTSKSISPSHSHKSDGKSNQKGSPKSPAAPFQRVHTVSLSAPSSRSPKHRSREGSSQPSERVKSGHTNSKEIILEHSNAPTNQSTLISSQITPTNRSGTLINDATKEKQSQTTENSKKGAKKTHGLVPKKLQWKLDYSKSHEKKNKASTEGSPKSKYPVQIDLSKDVPPNEVSPCKTGQVIDLTLPPRSEEGVGPPPKKAKRLSTNFSIAELCEFPNEKEDDTKSKDSKGGNVFQEDPETSGGRDSVIVPNPPTQIVPIKGPLEKFKERSSSSESDLDPENLLELKFDEPSSVSTDFDVKAQEKAKVEVENDPEEKDKVKQILNKVKKEEEEKRRTEGKVEEEKQIFLFENYGLITKEVNSEMELEILTRRYEKNTLPPLRIRPNSPPDTDPKSGLDNELVRVALNDPKSTHINPEEAAFLDVLGLRVASRTEKYKREKMWRFQLAEKMLREKRKPYLSSRKRKPWEKVSNLSKVLGPVLKGCGKWPRKSKRKCQEAEVTLTEKVKTEEAGNSEKSIPVISYPKYIPRYLYESEIEGAALKQDQSEQILKVPIVSTTESKDFKDSKESKEVKESETSTTDEEEVLEMHEEEDDLECVEKKSKLFDLSLVEEHFESWSKLEEGVRKMLDLIGAPSSTSRDEESKASSDYISSSNCKSILGELTRVRRHLKTQGKALKSLQKDISIKEKILVKSKKDNPRMNLLR